MYSLINIRCGHVFRDFESEAKIRVTFNPDKQDVIDFEKFLELKMCRASEANSKIVIDSFFFGKKFIKGCFFISALT